MNETIVVTTLGLLALVVGTLSLTRVTSSGRHRQRRTGPERQPNDGGGVAEMFDVTADAGCGDAGGGADGGGGGCD